MQKRIQEAVEKFATGLTAEIYSIMYDDLITDLQNQRAASKTLGGSANGNGKAKRKNGKTTAVKKAAKKKAPEKNVGAKRTPKQIERIATRALAAITKEPGQGIEAIAKALRVETKELAVPVKKLVGDKSIRTKGERRATKYYPKAAAKTAKKTKKTAKK